ncbi:MULTISPECIES: biotin transporter BioY [unclassified Agrococcus]|uniref:biotin transporter BioY n=1 Tax=unclassified Agrococcus TaxID=2615065 RepID=UPI00361F70F7
MTSIAAPAVLADRLVAHRSVATDVALVTGGAALTALLAQVAIPLWPVPITGQTLAVLVVGASLGAARGAASLALYAVLGVVGLPIFSDGASGLGVLMGTTGGYILGFIAAAALTGWLAERRWDRRFLGAVVAMTAGTLVTFAFGMTWLAVATGGSLEQILAWGLVPFIPGGIVKALLAAAILPIAWRGVRALDARRGQ